MLKRLQIKNFALIEDIDIEFKDEFTVITGQTGSGKSILLEALALIFGKRADSDYVRHNEKSAIVSAHFNINDKKASSLELPNIFCLTREIDTSGRNQIKLDNDVISLSRLKEITRHLGFIHQQEDSFILNDKSKFIDFIDQIDSQKTTALLNRYLLDRSSYFNKLTEHNGIKQKSKDSKQQIEYLQYQINELDSLNLVKDELRTLEDIVNKLSNYDKIKQLLTHSYESLNNQLFSIDNLYDAVKNIERLKDYDKEYENLYNRLNDSYYQLDDAIHDLSKMYHGFDFDQDIFDGYQERIYELKKIENKYQRSINELIDYLSDIKKELSIITDFDSYIAQSQKEVDKAYNTALESGQLLRKMRIKLKDQLTSLILTKLSDLDLDKASLNIVFNELSDNPVLLENGIDEVEYMISLNEGEPLKPLVKVASGGEKSRFMLAIRSIFASNEELSLLVFDEIDTGISGQTAAKVADELLKMSKERQIICITHLAQVAAKADSQYLISKHMTNGRMKTEIHHLNMDKRIEVIASMLSSDKISPHAIEQAKLLLDRKKREINSLVGTL